MSVQEITSNVFAVGSRDWDRRLFDELIPLPDGTSYNAYLIKGSKKTALIDSVDPTKTGELLQHIEDTKTDRIDYIISNHAEQDHSGSIPHLLGKFPQATLVTNDKCRTFLKDLLHIENDRFHVVAEGDTLSLGDKTLEFIITPWVHWPETMVTYLQEDKILFSCDFFGSHLATSSLFVENEAKTLKDAKRYFAEIMLPFRLLIKKNIEKIQQKNIRIIAPSHGPVYNKPEMIIHAYQEWVSDKLTNTVLIPFVSMHGSTAKMVDYLVEKLMEKNIHVIPFNVTQTDLGELAMELVDAATVVLATPTVLAGPHPGMVHVVSLMNILRPKLKYAVIIGSFGWGGKTVDIIKNNMSNLKLEYLEPVLIKGLPKTDDFRRLDNLVVSITANHQKLNL
jgi:flavorubredoxin